MTSQHPLDRDDPDDEAGFDFSSPQSGQTVSPEKRLLKLSVRAIVAFGVLVVFSSVAVNNIRYGSLEFTIASIINRLLMLLLLLSFAGVLLAYQLPNIRFKLNPMNSQPSNTNVVQRSLRPATGPMGWLVVVSVVVLALAWLAAFMTLTIAVPIASFMFATATGVLPGLLIAMIVWNKGCVRAYAIGALASYLLSTFGLFQPAILFSQMGIGANQWTRTGTGPNSSFASMIGIQWTTIVIGGLIPAWYVWLLEKGRTIVPNRFN